VGATGMVYVNVMKTEPKSSVDKFYDQEDLEQGKLLEQRPAI
jgi:hypothetical protein